jgi:Ca2+-binding EF-hand superfamily protein
MKAHSLFAAVLAVFVFGLPVRAAERDVQDFVYLGDKGPVLMRLHVRIDGKPLVDVWEEFVGKLFAYLDVNGDGALNKNEASRLPPMPMLFNNGPGFAGPRLNIVLALDKDHDGKITKDELTDWLRKNGAAPFQISAGGNQQIQTRLIIAGQAEPPSADAINEKLFTLLDTDKDGKLSREELARAPVILHKLDLDDDEMVSTQEMSGNVDTSNGTFVVRSVAFTGEQAGNNGPFVPVKLGEANTQLAQRLLNHYGKKGENASGKKLTQKELGLDDASFQRLDMDEDDKLDREELSRFAQRDPDLELRVHLGKRTGKEAAIELVQSKDHPSALAKSIRPGTGGNLTLELGSTQLEFGGAESSSEPQFAVRLRQQYLAQFRMADRDNNGYLDEKEAQQSPVYRNVFRMLDRDSDGKLFEKEIVAYLDRMNKLQELAMRSCASLSVKDQGRGLFDLVDANSDGRLGIREMRQMGKLIDELDRDGDGQISRGEIPHKYRVDVRRGPSLGNQFAPRAVVIRKFGMNNQQELPERSGPRWFQKMDRNHDGDVSRREFLGTEEEFRKIDTDGDGLISIEEAQRADEFFRKKKEQKP